MNEAIAMFDALIEAATIDALIHAKNEKLAQLQAVQVTKCGNCWHWMTSRCIPEKKHGRFKSCNSVACRNFVLVDRGYIIGRLRDEIKEFDERIAEARGGSDG